MVALLPPPEIQFSDGNGKPYAGGSVAFYIPATTTPKTTWSDAAGTVPNTNPVVLDLAGRAIIYGDGAYRAVLKDAAGNLIYDQLTSSIVSTALTAAIAAPDLATFLIDTGTTAAIAVETTNRTASDAVLTTIINGEIVRASAAELAILDAVHALTLVQTKAGDAVLDATGHLTIIFPVAFPTSIFSATANFKGSLNTTAIFTLSANLGTLDVWAYYNGVLAAPCSGLPFYWTAMGA